MGRMLIGRTLEEIKDDIDNNRIGIKRFLDKGLEEIESALRDNREEVCDGEMLSIAEWNYFEILTYLKKPEFKGRIFLEGYSNSKDLIKQYSDKAEDIFNSLCFKNRRDLADARKKSKSRIEPSHRSNESSIQVMPLSPSVRAAFEIK